jgi:hypothetical protein
VATALGPCVFPQVNATSKRDLGTEGTEIPSYELDKAMFSYARAYTRNMLVQLITRKLSPYSPSLESPRGPDLGKCTGTEAEGPTAGFSVGLCRSLSAGFSMR